MSTASLSPSRCVIQRAVGAFALLALAACDKAGPLYLAAAPSAARPSVGPAPVAFTLPQPIPSHEPLLASTPAPEPPLPSVGDAGNNGGCDTPARFIKVGELLKVETTWTPGDVLSDWQTSRSWYAPTLLPTAYRAPSGTAFRDEDPSRWRLSPGPDGMSVDVFEAGSGKPITGKAPFVIAVGGLAVDAQGRVFDLTRRGYVDEKPFRCHPTERPTFDISLTGRFLVCDAYGRGLAVRDRIRGWEAVLGDGKLALSPDDGFGLLIPGPFDGRGGHVETTRRTVDKIRFGPSGVMNVKPVGPAGASVALSGKGAYAILSRKDLIVYRACDDAAIARVEVAAKAARIAFNPSGSVLAVTSEEGTIVYRME